MYLGLGQYSRAPFKPQQGATTAEVGKQAGEWHELIRGRQV